MKSCNNNTNLPFTTLILYYSVTPGLVLAANELHDIAPPINYSLVPPWLIFGVAFLSLAVAGSLIWLFVRSRRHITPPPTPRQRALESLEVMLHATDRIAPYRFSIRVSDVLRRYVTDQYNLPVTRQTSYEFLTALAKSSPFSQPEKALLEDFLTRCDLIKFARYNATVADSRLLIDEAIRFVKGGELALA